MNESHDRGPVTIPGGPGQPSLHFTEAEWQQFRKSDHGAGKSVVLLMASIFAIGLLLYSAVAYICWFNVM